MHAIRKFTRLHSTEHSKIFLDRALAVRAVLPGLAQCAAQRANFICSEAIHVGLALPDEEFSKLI